MYKIGDKYKLGYIKDCYLHNYEEGIIIWLHDYYFYPFGTYDKKELWSQGLVKMKNGDEVPIKFKKESEVN